MFRSNTGVPPHVGMLLPMMRGAMPTSPGGAVPLSQNGYAAHRYGTAWPLWFSRNRNQPGRHPLRRSRTVRVKKPAFSRRGRAHSCQHHNAAHQLRKRRAAQTPKAEMSSGRSGAVTWGKRSRALYAQRIRTNLAIKVHSSLSNAAIGKALRASSGSRTGVDGGSALKMRSRKKENTAREKYYVNSQQTVSRTRGSATG